MIEICPYGTRKDLASEQNNTKMINFNNVTKKKHKRTKSNHLPQITDHSYKVLIIEGLESRKTHSYYLI